jgi:hypothetical protein
MVAAWLFGNFPTGNWISDIFAGSDQEWGTRFTPEASGVVNGLRWFRANGTGAQKPTILRLWDVATATVLHTASAIPDNGAIAWQEYAIPAPIAVTAGSEYCVSFAWQTNRAKTSYGLGSGRPGDYPAKLWIPAGCSTTAGSIGFPATRQPGSVFGVDARIRTTAPAQTWTSAGSTAYNDTLKLTTPANRYRLNLTTVVQWQTAKVVEGVDIRRVVGFWQPFLDGYLLERKPIDALQFDMMLPDRGLMDGLLLDTFPGSAGTVEAFVLDT